MGRYGTTSSAPTNVRQRFYKPLILRVPGVLCIFGIAVVLIGVLEYAARSLPLVENRTHVPEISHLSSLLRKRESVSTSVTTIIASTTIQDAYVPTSSTTKPPQTETTIPNAYVPPDSTSTKTPLTGTTNPNAYVPTGSTSTQHPGSTSTTFYPTPGSSFSTGPGAYVTTASTSTASLGTTANSAYLTTATRVTVLTSLSTDASGGVATVLSSYKTTQTQQMITKTGVSILSTTDAAGHTRTTSVSYTTVGFLDPSPASDQADNSKFQTAVITWPMWWVFVSGYLPLLLAILVKILWTSVYANIKLLEPFMQLSKPDGALASDALCTYYLSSSLMPDPVVALIKRRWLVFWSSVVYLVVGLLGPLASEVIFLDLHYDCGAETCWPPKLSADGTVLRLLQGLLSFIGIMALTITVMVHRSTTGVYSNPSSIAAIASLLHHPEVLDDFRNLDDNISSKDLKKQLGGKRYQLGTYQREDGVMRYGIIPASQAYSPGWTQISLGQAGKPAKTERKRTHLVSTVLDLGFVAFILGLLGVVISYFLDGSNSAFNRFFNSNAFGPRFFMSSMGTIIAMYWKSIERKIQTLTPFHRLLTSPSPAKPTILFARHTLPPLTLYTSLINHHFFAFLIALTTLLADILTITLSVIPFSPNEVYLELLICSYTSIAILSIMVIVVIGLLFWKRKVGDMPRKPDTLAGVISYLCDSRFLGGFEGYENLRGGELEKRVGKTGKRFRFGRFAGVGGRKRWMVNEVGVVL